MTEQFDSEIPVLRNEDIVANYTNRLQAAVDYDGSVDEAKDLYQQSITVTPPSQDDSGIPEDLGNAPINTPDIQLGEQEEPLMARLFNSAPESVQKMLTPFLVPFTNNPVMKGITIGTGDAINGTLNLLRDVNNAMHPDHQFSEEEWMQLPEIIERGDSTTEAIVGGLTQFMSVYGALGKVSSVNKLSSKAKKVFDDMWRAGIADAAFDPEEGNLATLINMLDEDTTVAGLPIGQMNGPFTQWLGTPVGEDAEAFERLEQRAKNLLEGAGLGLLANGLIGGLKGLKQIMIESDPDRYFAMLKKAGFDVDPRQFLFENTLGAENIVTPQVNELGMYSQLEKAMLNMTQDKNKPDDLLRYLRKNGVTNDELNNSGVMDLINEKKAAGESLTKDEVMEVFTDMDVTQSYQATTRTYERPSDIDSMTDEEDLLEVYYGANEERLAELRSDDFNGRVLEYDEVDAELDDMTNDIMEDYLNDTATSAGRIELFGKMHELYPEKYPEGKDGFAPDKWFDQFRNINLDDEFKDHAYEATRLIAEKRYDLNPKFQWDLTEGDFFYQITGNEDYGYTTKIWDDANREATELDVVYSANEAMVQVQAHQANFRPHAIRTEDDTKFSDLIVHTKAVDTYKETVVTADSPSGTIFTGGRLHFPEDNKVFHLRTTEPDADTLYIEELQSDWANDISKKGVKKGQEYNQSARKALQDAVAERNAFLETTDWEFSGERLMGDEEALVPRNRDIDGDTLWKETDGKVIEKIVAYNKVVDDLKDKVKAEDQAVPQSPLPNDRWINVGLRTAIAQAIDSGKTRVEWTPAQVHVDRWSGQYEKMYKILYDQKMGGIAKKIANKYNAEFGQHYIDISPEMIAHHKSGKGDKAMAAAPAIPAAQVANDKEDKS